MRRTNSSVLRELNARLDLSARRRAMLLRELRGDLDDLAATLVVEGLTPDAAHARALQLLAPTADEAGALNGLHRPAYARMVRLARPGRVRFAERTGIGAMAALAVLAPLQALARTSLLPLSVLVALGCVALPLVANLAWQAFRIVVRDDADSRSLARAGAVQAALVALILTVGALLTVTEAMVQADALSTLGPADPSTILALVVGAATRCAAIGALTLGLTILGVFGALALLQWHMAARDVENELEALLESPFSLNPE